MLLRKLVAALCPLLYCALLSIVFRWLDGLGGLNSFWAFAIKGLLLGAAVSLVLPAAGVKSRMNGLQPWLYIGAGLLMVVVFLQFLASTGALHLTVLELIGVNGQVVLVESTMAGFMLVTALMNRRR
ncbi:MAG: hypothetical protein E7319_07775 [Clostridiales bacterium]|nr:hypothetical protein [Clostridiales bacterium]